MKGEAFSCARVLIETSMIESIGGTVIIVCDGHHCKVAIREVPMCPSAPCSLASSLELVVIVDFPIEDGCGTWKCNGLTDHQESQQSPH